MRNTIFQFAICLTIVSSWSFDTRGAGTESGTGSNELGYDYVDDKGNDEATNISDSTSRSSKKSNSEEPRSFSGQENGRSAANTYAISDVKKFNKIGAWIAYSIGGLAAIGAAVTGIVLLDQHATLEENCRNKQCAESQWESLDLAKDLATTTDVLIGIAAAGIATGTVFLLIQATENAKKKTARVTPTFGPRGAGAAVVGEF